MYSSHFPSTMRFIGILLLCCSTFSAVAQMEKLPEENKKVIERYFNELLNTQNPSRMNEFFSEDFTWHQMNGTDISSKSDSTHMSAMKFVFTAIPDIHYTINNLVAEKDMVAVNCTITGTANAERFGFPPTQQKVSFKQMFFFRLANKKIMEEWEVVDLDGLKAQLSTKQ